MCLQFIVIHTVKGFGIVNKAEIDVFLELSCFVFTGLCVRQESDAFQQQLMQRLRHISMK